MSFWHIPTAFPSSCVPCRRIECKPLEIKVLRIIEKTLRSGGKDTAEKKVFLCGRKPFPPQRKDTRSAVFLQKRTTLYFSMAYKSRKASESRKRKERCLAQPCAPFSRFCLHRKQEKAVGPCRFDSPTAFGKKVWILIGKRQKRTFSVRAVPSPRTVRRRTTPRPGTSGRLRPARSR